MLFPPTTHADNPPETWKVRKVTNRNWELTTKDGDVLDRFRTKEAAEAAKASGFLVTLYAKEKRHYAGEHIPGWRPFEGRAASDQ